MIFFPYVRFSVYVDNYHHKLRLLGAGLTLDMAMDFGHAGFTSFWEIIMFYGPRRGPTEAHLGPMQLKAVSPETTGIHSD